MTREWRFDLTEDEQRRVDEVAWLVAELDAVPLSQADELFYAHGYNELRLAIDDLLAMLRSAHGEASAGS